MHMARLPSADLKVDLDTYAIDNEKATVVVPYGAMNTMDAINIDTKMHARVLRKVDRHVLPLVSLLYFLAFLDRSNIGNAKIAGMEADLELVGLRYNIATSVFFVTYCLGQVPSNIILKLFRPSRWIPIITVTWGLIMTLMCLVQTYQQLLVTRVLLGLAAAGILPGVTYYISLWYPRGALAKRIAIFTSIATMAGAFNGILAYAIEKMEGIGGLHGWQWIFCLEGLTTILVALVAPFFIYDFPKTATFLTEAERCYIVEMMTEDSQGLATHFSFQFVLQALRDYKTYLQFGAIIGFSVLAYAITLFMPTIVNDLSFSAANSQLLCVAPFAAGCITTVLAGIYSDRHRLRGPYVVAGAIVGLVGCIILSTQTQPGVALVGVILIMMGIFPSAPIVFTWAGSNAGGDVKRGVAIAMVSSLSNTGGIYSSFIFIDPPRFHAGLGISMGLLSCSLLTCLFMMWDYNRMNKQKEKFCREHGITDDDKDKFVEQGDDSPLFRYTL